MEQTGISPMIRAHAQWHECEMFAAYVEVVSILRTMRAEVPMRFARRTALALTLCACESAAPASSREAARPLASEWTGQRAMASVASSASPGVEPTKGGWVLHVGDSFVNASFAQSLTTRFRTAGVRQVAIAKTATYTTSWASDPELDQWLSRRPSLILVTLGANEVDNTVPRLHAPAIHSLARKVGAAAPCVWIAPPLWKEDGPGWLQVLHDHCAPCLFFDSDAVLGGLTAGERRSDGIHPNEGGGPGGGSGFWGWFAPLGDGPWGGGGRFLCCRGGRWGAGSRSDRARIPYGVNEMSSIQISNVKGVRLPVSVLSSKPIV